MPPQAQVGALSQIHSAREAIHEIVSQQAEYLRVPDVERMRHLHLCLFPAENQGHAHCPLDPLRAEDVGRT